MKYASSRHSRLSWNFMCKKSIPLKTREKKRKSFWVIYACAYLEIMKNIFSFVVDTFDRLLKGFSNSSSITIMCWACGNQGLTSVSYYSWKSTKNIVSIQVSLHLVWKGWHLIKQNLSMLIIVSTIQLKRTIDLLEKV